MAGTTLAGRIDFPCTWQEFFAAIGGAAEPRARFSPAPLTLRRRFHQPTGIEARERVFLSLRHSGARLVARLNGDALTLAHEAGGVSRADITALLADRNELTIEISPPSPPLPDFPADVLEATLEIRQR
jgi:hypothetical protein